MLQIQEKPNKSELRKVAIWQQAFRPFFLFGSVFSVVAIGLWIAVLMGVIHIRPYGDVIFWHAHEMLFGFVGAIIVGFLLTAVQNWTGMRAIHGKRLILLFLLWLIARIAMLVGEPNHQWFIFVLDICFFPTAAIFFASLVFRSNNNRNYQFIPIFLFLTYSSMLTHFYVLFENHKYFIWGMDLAIFLVTLIMVIMGGRVIPLFTASGTGKKPAFPLKWLELSAVLSSWLIVLVFLLNVESIIPYYLVGGVFLIAAVSNAVRAARWKIWITARYPLVWSLHLAYWFIPVGYGLFALRFFGFDISRSSALHCLTAGAMGSLILSMISRVSLGHTGRLLVVHGVVGFAFVLIFFASIIRLIAGLNSSVGISGYFIAAMLWVAAYGVYLLYYIRILVLPRADGKPG